MKITSAEASILANQYKLLFIEKAPDVDVNFSYTGSQRTPGWMRIEWTLGKVTGYLEFNPERGREEFIAYLEGFKKDFERQDHQKLRENK